MENKTLRNIIGAGILGLAGLASADYYEYVNKIPTVNYPGDFSGKIDDEDIYLKRYYGGMTRLEIERVSPGKTRGLFISYHDHNNDGTIDFFNSEYQEMPSGGGTLFGYSRKFVDPIVKRGKTREGKMVTKEDQQKYNDYLTKIAQINSKQKKENKK